MENVDVDDPNEEEYDRVETRTDWDGLFADLGEWLDESPPRDKSRFTRFYKTLFHIFMTGVTAGAYLIAYFVWFFYRFFGNVNWDEYQHKVYIREEEVDEQQE